MEVAQSIVMSVEMNARMLASHAMEPALPMVDLSCVEETSADLTRCTGTVLMLHLERRSVSATVFLAMENVPTA